MNDDDDEDSESINVVIDYTQKVNIVRFISGGLMPSRLSIKAEVLPSEDNTDEIDFDVIFAKIKFWFENIVSRSVVFCRSNSVAIGMLLYEDGRAKLANHMMITPFEPTDEHLAVLFQSKMSALADGKISFGCVKVRSDMSNLVFTYVGDWKKDLPEMKDWFSQKPYYFDTPWWTRGDVSTVDMIIVKSDGSDPDVDSPPPWAFTLDFIEKSFKRIKENIIEEETEDNEIIKFKPKIIDGGKDDPED